MQLRMPSQVDRVAGVIDLNPPNRRQNKKHRPRIPLTGNLAGWLDEWNSDAPLRWDGQSIGAIKWTFKRHAEACGLPRFTQGTIRHFMATEVRLVRPLPATEQQDAWLGHGRKRTAHFYESRGPEFLRECKTATEIVIGKLQQHTQRCLDARKLHGSDQPEARKLPSDPRKLLTYPGLDGGRDRY
ncbi:hypothetical protein ABGN05_00010 [Aquibium sp. LZ166]|uniref:Phage integrase family protein n=1 Tax=Aquibium pacificus TaxID=3153579 RepID=A0ABV3SBB8_9HYPH